jgi:hypothetical protein
MNCFLFENILKKFKKKIIFNINTLKKIKKNIINPEGIT